MGYQYRASVLEALLSHGIRPSDRTPPRLARTFLNDLYRFEIRRLRDRLLDGEFPKATYAARVVEIRTRYPLLSLDIHLWTEGSE